MVGMTIHSLHSGLTAVVSIRLNDMFFGFFIFNSNRFGESLSSHDLINGFLKNHHYR